MPFLITDSTVPLLMDTVPALKLCHFRGVPQHDTVYAYLRCYVIKGALHFSATCFDAAPLATTRFALALCPAARTDCYLLFSLCKGGENTLCVLDSVTGTPLQTCSAPPARVVTGTDEQGVYWCAESEIPAAVFTAVFGEAPKAGLVYAGNVFLYDTADAAFGAAFPVPRGEKAPTAKGFDAFTVVPY